MSRYLPRAHTLIALAWLSGVATPDAAAQARVTFQPFAAVTAGYDSDVFATGRQPRADVVTRLTPGADGTYKTPLATLSGRYETDLERFMQYPELTALNARQHGTIAIASRPTPLLAVTAGGEFLATRMPGELTIATGLTLPRGRARRSSARASVARRFGTVTSADVGYALTDDRLNRSFAARTHAVDARLVREVSPRTALRAAYRIETTGFAAAADATRVTSNALSVGIDRAITPRVRASIAAGPRLTGGSLQPEIAASVACDCAPASLAVAYEQTQTTVIGLAGAAGVRRVNVTLRRRFGRSLDLGLAPSFFRTVLGQARTDVYAIAFSVTRPLASRLAVEVDVHGAMQHGSLHPAAARQSVARHAASLRLVAGPAAALPRR
jgi:hypothetical protein